MSDTQEYGAPKTFKMKVSRTSTGAYSWEFSVYGAKNAAEAEDLANEAIEAINQSIQHADEHITIPSKK